MGAHTSLTNQFLIAMPTLEDPNFLRTVTYICEHTEHGALGIVINRPLDITLGTVLEHMDITGARLDVTEEPVYLGGPVQPERGFVLHTPAGEWGSTVAVTETLAVTTSRDILEAIAQNRGPKQYFIALGYAGWGPGQLEIEMGQNAWLNGPSSPAILFDTPAELRWEAAAALMGVNLSLLSTTAGHA